MIAYCRLTVNPHDEEAFKRVVNYPARGIGQTTVDKIVSAASTDGVSLWEVVSRPEEHFLPVNKGTMGKLKSVHGYYLRFHRENRADGCRLSHTGNHP